MGRTGTESLVYGANGTASLALNIPQYPACTYLACLAIMIIENVTKTADWQNHICRLENRTCRWRNVL